MSASHFVFTAAVVAMTLAGPARAADDFLAAGATYGGPAQKTVVCYFTNLEDSAVRIKQFRIVNQIGQTLPLSVDDCTPRGGVLSAFGTCGIAATLADDNNNFHACRTLVSVTNKPKLRGTLEIRDVNQGILNSLALQ